MHMGIVTCRHNHNDMFSRNLFAYSSSDRLIYLRQFATKGADMKLVATMSGHVSEVVQVAIKNYITYVGVINFYT